LKRKALPMDTTKPRKFLCRSCPRFYKRFLAIKGEGHHVNEFANMIWGCAFWPFRPDAIEFSDQHALFELVEISDLLLLEESENPWASS